MGKVIQLMKDETIQSINMEDVRDQMFLVREAYQILRDRNNLERVTLGDVDTLKHTVEALLEEIRKMAGGVR